MKPSSFGKMLEDVLQVKKIEKQELAEKMGIDKSNITRYIKLDHATIKLITRIEKAIDIEIIRQNDQYIWIDKNINQAQDPSAKYTFNTTDQSESDSINKAKAQVKKRLHDAIVEAIINSPEQHRADVIKYFLDLQSSIDL